MKKFILILVMIVLFISAAAAQTTEFAYQGNLRDGANPANGNYDFHFGLYSVAAGGTPIKLLSAPAEKFA